MIPVTKNVSATNLIKGSTACSINLVTSVPIDSESDHVN